MKITALGGNPGWGGGRAAPPFIAKILFPRETRRRLQWGLEGQGLGKRVWIELPPHLCSWIWSLAAPSTWAHLLPPHASRRAATPPRLPSKGQPRGPGGWVQLHLLGERLCPGGGDRETPTCKLESPRGAFIPPTPNSAHQVQLATAPAPGERPDVPPAGQPEVQVLGRSQTRGGRRGGRAGGLQQWPLAGGPERSLATALEVVLNTAASRNCRGAEGRGGSAPIWQLEGEDLFS